MLVKGQKIYMDDFSYELMTDALENKKLKEVLYTAKAMKCTEKGEREERFIKFVSTDQKELLKRLQKESRFVMHYPFISKVYGGGVGKTEDDDRVFVVEIEYIRGDDLKNAMELGYFKDKDQETQILRLFYQLLRAGYYYSKCEREEEAYLHRDIKPENIMLVERNGKFYPVLIDFDFAHIRGSNSTDVLLDRQDKVFNLGGTFGYADPRAWGPFKLDIQSDIYSMGRTFCFCLLSDEWRNMDLGGDGLNEYYTYEEYIRVGRKMAKLCERKAKGLSLPEETDASYFYPGWMELAYGIQMDRFTSRYGEEKYAPLMRILKKMVAPPWARYKDFGIILKDMETFLISFYGKEKMEELGFFDMLLENHKRENAKDTVAYFCEYVSGDGKYKQPFTQYHELKHGEMQDLFLCNVKIGMLFNKKGELYYLTYGDVKTDSGVSSGLLGKRKKNKISYRGYSMYITMDVA